MQVSLACTEFKDHKLMATRPEVTGRKVGVTPPGNDDDLLLPGVVAEWLDLTEQWLQQARDKNIGPKFVRLAPKSFRYRKGDVRLWIEANTHNCNADFERPRRTGVTRRSKERATV
jgi:hypothetical protein